MLHGRYALFVETVGEAVFVDFLDVTVPEMLVEGEARLADQIAQGKDRLGGVHLPTFALFAPLGGKIFYNPNFSSRR